jgi:hypothetical protein
MDNAATIWPLLAFEGFLALQDRPPAAEVIAAEAA